MIIEKGEKLHIVTRRRFAEDVRRHFVGIVLEAEGAVVRMEGYVFVFDTSKNQFVKKPEKRHAFFDVATEGYIVNVLPADAVVEDMTYVVTDKGKLSFTDSRQFSLDINEFGIKR